MSELTLYHGSSKIIKKTQYGVGNAHNDYGLGFYCTERANLAAEWAVTEAADGFVNSYSLSTEGLTILNLCSGDFHILNWLAILLENRSFGVKSSILPAKEYILNTFLPDYKKYDVIRGYRADDSYFAFANAFINNGLSLEKLSEAMYLGELGEQVVLKSENAFSAIEFTGFEIADCERYYIKKKSRDDSARFSFQSMKNDFRDGTYLIDIIREDWRNDDERLQRIIH